MNVTILGISSGIGYELAYRFIAEGDRVQGTYRNNRPDAYGISEGSPFPNCASPYLRQCDVEITNHLLEAAEKFEPWDLLVCCVGTMTPVGKFMGVNPIEFEFAVRANALGPLEFLNYFWPKRRKGASVCFLSGPNLSKPTPGFTAYRAGKSLLTDMVTQLAVEEPEHKFFMLAPGVVQTKIHEQAEDQRSKDILAGKEKTTPHDDIYRCLRWCLDQPKESITGRQIHVVNDPWRGCYRREILDPFKVSI